MANEVVEAQNNIVSRDMLPADITERVKEAARQNNALMTMMDSLLEEGTDFGRVPGVPKPFLHQPGAQQLGLVFKLRPEFEILDKTVDFDMDPTLVVYDIKCKIYQRESEAFLGEGVGSCTNYERKYKYYKDKTVFEDPLDRINTILKMAKKRAYVDAILNVTGASRLFTQDPDLVDGSNGSKQLDDKKPENVEIWFGKHKGKKLSELPTSYLNWLKDNAKQNDLQEAAAKVLEQMQDKYSAGSQSKGKKNSNSSSSSNNSSDESINSKINQEHPEKTILWFGKFEGKKLEEANSGYLKWLIDNDKTNKQLKMAAKLTLDKHKSSKEERPKKKEKRETTEREAEIKELIGDDQKKKNMLFNLLSSFNAKSINSLDEEEYLILRNSLRDKDAGPTEEDLKAYDDMSMEEVYEDFEKTLEEEDNE